jgi:hypothetical protein
VAIFFERTGLEAGLKAQRVMPEGVGQVGSPIHVEDHVGGFVQLVQDGFSYGSVRGLLMYSFIAGRLGRTIRQLLTTCTNHELNDTVLREIVRAIKTNFFDAHSHALTNIGEIKQHAVPEFTFI